MQTKWGAILDPVLGNPSLQCRILSNVSLVAGSNTINHGLGKNLQGWRIVRQRSAASVYDNQDNNSKPDLTLILVSSAAVVVNLEVF
jgi:hypothetical protein